MAANGETIEIQTKLCNHCKKDVFSANYDMHVVHCQRFMKFCETCNKAFSKNAWDEHNQEFHSEVVCRECGKSMERRLLDDHMKSECQFRSTRCLYCDMSLPLCKMGEHEKFCGTRTELCQKCNRYVKIRELSDHRCSPFFDNVAAHSSRNLEFGACCDARGMGHAFFGHHTLSFPLTPSRKCEYCGLSENSLGMMISEHKAFCPKQLVSCRYCPEEVQVAFLESHEANCPGLTTICPSCFDPVRQTDLDGHSKTCRAANHTSICDTPYNPTVEDMDTLHSRGGHSAGDFRMDNEFCLNDFERLGVEDKSARVQLPCEFCHQLFDIDILIQHESGCEMGEPFASELGIAKRRN